MLPCRIYINKCCECSTDYALCIKHRTVATLRAIQFPKKNEAKICIDLGDGSSTKSMRRIRVGQLSMLPSRSSRCPSRDTDILCKEKEGVVEKKQVKLLPDIFYYISRRHRRSSIKSKSEQRQSDSILKQTPQIKSAHEAIGVSARLV
jgi:hypothetical protein